MNSDNRQRSRESIRIRQEHGRYLVVHTGKVTEKEYLEDLKGQLYNGVLTLKYGKNLRECVRIASDGGRKAETQGDPFDVIYIVDDIDGRSREQIDTMCESLGPSETPVMLTFSNPCIEVWLLCYTGKVSSDAGTIDGVQRIVKKAGLVGGHHDKHISVSLRDYEKAIKTARRLRATYGDDVLSCTPTTDMDLMVEKLLDEIKE